MRRKTNGQSMDAKWNHFAGCLCQKHHKNKLTVLSVSSSGINKISKQIEEALRDGRLSHWSNMARDFAKAFYKSKEWQNVREYILRRDNYMCTKCSASYPLEVHHIIHLTPDNIGDVSITLNEKNLTTLCRDCHFDEHKADKAEGHRKKIPDENDYIFDENGYLVRKSPPKI